MQKVEKRVFEGILKNGLKEYYENDKRIEFLSCSIDTDDKNDIVIYFEKLLETMKYKNKFGIIDYCGVIVNKQHMHVFIKKPFVYKEILKENWQRITNNKSNILMKTLFSKGYRNISQSLLSVCNYVLIQDDKHDFAKVEYIFSDDWGIVKKKKVKSFNKRVVKYKGMDLNDYYYIDGKYILITDFNNDKYGIKTKYNGNKEKKDV